MGGFYKPDPSLGTVKVVAFTGCESDVPLTCLPPVSTGGEGSINDETSRLQPGFSTRIYPLACQAKVHCPRAIPLNFVTRKLKRSIGSLAERFSMPPKRSGSCRTVGKVAECSGNLDDHSPKAFTSRVFAGFIKTHSDHVAQGLFTVQALNRADAQMARFARGNIWQNGSPRRGIAEARHRYWLARDAAGSLRLPLHKPAAKSPNPAGLSSGGLRSPFHRASVYEKLPALSHFACARIGEARSGQRAQGLPCSLSNVR